MFTNLRSTARWLRRHFPCEHRVIIRVTDRFRIRNWDDHPSYPGDDSNCLRFEKSWVIKLANDMAEDMQVEALLHEWAHALTLPHWNEPVVYHTSAWKRAIGEIHAARERHKGNP